MATNITIKGLSMSKEVWVAIIGAISSVGIAYLSGTFSAERAVAEERQKVSGGTISNRGEILARVGRTFTVSAEGVARVRVTFDQKFAKKPIALTTTYQEGASTTARVEFIDERSLVVTTRSYSNDTPTPAPFNFMVLEALESK